MISNRRYAQHRTTSLQLIYAILWYDRFGECYSFSQFINTGTQLKQQWFLICWNWRNALQMKAKKFSHKWNRCNMKIKNGITSVLKLTKREKYVIRLWLCQETRVHKHNWMRVILFLSDKICSKKKKFIGFWMYIFVLHQHNACWVCGMIVQATFGKCVLERINRYTVSSDSARCCKEIEILSTPLAICHDWFDWQNLMVSIRMQEGNQVVQHRDTPVQL